MGTGRESDGARTIKTCLCDDAKKNNQISVEVNIQENVLNVHGGGFHARGGM